jgi:glycosyltransferase involved in cell wall biosynthesis
MRVDGYLSIVVPVYNEEPTIAALVDRLVKLPGLLEVIVVDDCSSDRTPQILDQLKSRHPQLMTLRHQRNEGKTAALKTGIEKTTGRIVVVQDGDSEYDPSQIGDLVKPILDGEAEIVYGSRFLLRDSAVCAYPGQYMANRVLTIAMNLLLNLQLTDVETGYKAFRGEILRRVQITSSRFGFEIEVTARLAKLGYRIQERSIVYRARGYKEGKKLMPWDLIAAFFYVLRFGLTA